MTRNEIRNHIINIADSKNLDFMIKLIPNITQKCYGVKIPVLRSLALKIDIKEIINPMEDDCYEEIILRGLVIAKLKCDFEIKLVYIKTFVPQINNWAICDTFCSSLKIETKNRDEFRQFLNYYINSQNEFEKRFAIISLMGRYTDEKSIDDTLAVFNQSASDKYYIQMAVAWAVSVCFIKHREKTIEFLKNNNLDGYTHNKSIQKIKESLRVTKQDKELVTKLKLKL